MTVKLQSIKSKEAPPALILLPEQMRRINDMGAFMEQKLPGLPEYHVLLINKEHPLISALNKLSNKKILLKGEENKDDLLSKKIVTQIYEMAKLSVGGIDQKDLHNLQINNATLITELLNSK